MQMLQPARSRAILPLIVALVVLAPAASRPGIALAHLPIDLGSDHQSPDTAAPLGDPASPGLVTGVLPPWAAQYVSFTISGNQPFHAMVLLPLGNVAFTPSMAVVGPGLGDPITDQFTAPFALPSGDGIYYIAAPSTRLPIFLPDLGLRFIAGAGTDGPLGQDGDYFLVIYSADGSSGSYTVGTGYGP